MRKPSLWQRLLRERALGRYITALEDGNLDVLAVLMRRAEKDAILEHLIFELHETYQTEDDFLAMIQKEGVIEIEDGVYKSIPHGRRSVEPEPVPEHRLVNLLLRAGIKSLWVGCKYWRPP